MFLDIGCECHSACHAFSALILLLCRMWVHFSFSCFFQTLILLFHRMWVDFCLPCFLSLDSYHSIVGECIPICHAISALTLTVLHIGCECIYSICAFSALIWLLHRMWVHFWLSCFLSLDSYCSIVSEHIFACHTFLALFLLFYSGWVFLLIMISCPCFALP